MVSEPGHCCTCRCSSTSQCYTISKCSPDWRVGNVFYHFFCFQWFHIRFGDRMADRILRNLTTLSVVIWEYSVWSHIMFFNSKHVPNWQLSSQVCHHWYIRRQAILCTSVSLFLIEPMGKKSNRIWVKKQQYSPMKIDLKMSYPNGSHFVSNSMWWYERHSKIIQSLKWCSRWILTFTFF